MDSTILEAAFEYDYVDDDGCSISFNKGERFILLSKTSEDWWKVQRTGVFKGKSICYVPASYVKEINITPRGKSGFVNQYVNMEVYKKIMKRDVEGLAKLGHQSMVVSRPNNAQIISVGGDKNSEEESDEEEVTSSDEEEDDTFDRSLDEIPADLRSLNLNASDKGDRSPTEPFPLSFEISPRTNQMKSFTLPAGGRFSQSTKRENSTSSFYKEAIRKLPSSYSTSSLSDHSQEKVEIPSITTSPLSTDVPNGWSVEIEPHTQDEIFLNSVTKERWKSCVDQTGRKYYYNLNGPGTAWNLPELADFSKPKALRRKSFDESLKGVIRRQTISPSSKSPRTKCHSVHVRSPSSLSSEEDTKLSKSPSVSPTLPPKLKKPNHQRIGSAHSFEIIDINQVDNIDDEHHHQSPKAEKTGQLLRRKVVEGRKQMKKPVWVPIYVCKYDSNLVFYKDQKSASPKPGYPTGKPESSLDLHGATLDHISKEKVKGKKYVFQIASYGGQNIHQFVADNQLEMGEWIVCIQATINKLEVEEPLPPHPLQNGTARDAERPLMTSPTTSLAPPTELSPTSGNKSSTLSPMMPKKLQTSEKGGFKGFSRRLSKRVTGSGNDDEKEKTKIRDKLKRYLSKRPSFNELQSKGIITDFVFGYPLEKLCEREENLVPKFIVQIIHEVERRGLDVDGIYRVSGNLSSINKLRGLIDNGEAPNYAQSEWNDIHLLTGCLKLYFRELPEPLLPFHLFQRFVSATKSPFKPEKIKLMKELVSELKAERKETLNLLITHFTRVIEFSSQNRMHSQNLAIVFGPTLLWPEVSDSTSMAMTTVFQNQVIELLLQEWGQIYVC